MPSPHPHTLCSRRGEHDGDDETVKGQSLSEDHHKNESDQDISLGVATDTSVTNNSNAEASSEGGKTAAESCSEGSVALVVVVAPVLRVLHVLLVVGDLGD